MRVSTSLTIGLSSLASSTAYFLASPAVPAPFDVRPTARCSAPLMQKYMPGESPNELLRAADEEEEAEWEAEVKAAADAARSPEVLGKKRNTASAVVDALNAAIDADASHPAAKAIANKGKSPATGKLLKSMKKPKGTIAILAEGVPIGTVSMGGFDLNDPVYLSSQFRDGGAVAIVVPEDDTKLTDTALVDTVAEQDTVRGEFPGPLPVIVRADVIDEVQLAKQVGEGAKGVVLDMVLNGADKTQELFESATQLGLDSIVRVGTEDELVAALSFGAKAVAIGDCGFELATKLLSQIPKDVTSVCDVDIKDVRDAWKARDLGFNALAISKAMLLTCQRDRAPPAAVIKAMLSKGSVKFGLGMQLGRLEGSKENLGYIAM